MARQVLQGWIKTLAVLALVSLMVVPLASMACDSFDGSTLTIAKVIVGNTVYTNVRVRLGLPNVKSVGASVGNPATADTYDVYDSSTGLLVIACVIVGPTTYSNVTTSIIQVLGIGGSYTLPTAPTLIPNFPMKEAFVGTPYSLKAYSDVVPHSQYTFTIDSLANGNGTPPGMTLDINGVLSGTAFATGATDINGNQIAHAYTFGVCATDTLSRLTTASPCPQVTVNVRPALPKLAGSWSGAWSNTGPGDGGCTYHDSGTLKLTLIQDGTTLSGTVTATGIQLQYVPDCVFAFNTTSTASVTGSIASDNTITLQYTLPISETGGSIPYTWSATLSGTSTLMGLRSSSKQSGSFTLTH